MDTNDTRWGVTVELDGRPFTVAGDGTTQEPIDADFEFETIETHKSDVYKTWAHTGFAALTLTCRGRFEDTD